MAQCITEDQVQWAQHQHQVEYSKVKDYQDIWDVETVTIQNLEVVRSRYGQERNIS